MLDTRDYVRVHGCAPNMNRVSVWSYTRSDRPGEQEWAGTVASLVTFSDALGAEIAVRLLP